VRLLERDVVTGVCRGERVQVLGWLLLVWDGKWAVRLLECDFVTGVWRGERVQEGGVG